MSYRIGVRTFLLFVALSGNVIQSYRFNESADRPQIVSSDDELNQRPTLAEYLNQRRALLNQEFNASFESDVKLNENERLANEIIMRAKNKEVNGGLANPYSFNPSRHIFEVLQDVRNSDLFKILAKMPKGAILHSHDTALCSADYLVTLTYWPNLWQCTENGTIAKLLFSRARPEPETTINCTWTLVSDERKSMGAAKYDVYVRKLFTLFDKDVHPKIQYNDINDVWQAMMRIFGRITFMLGYAPAWKAYYKNALKEVYADNVQYLEFRSTLPPVYDLDGRTYTPEEILGIYVEALEEFKSENPGFIGSKVIYAPIKNVPNATAQGYFPVIPKLHARFPDFFAGFDLVGQEDPSPLLINFVENLLQVPKEINFYMHAGETNWYGSIDENLIDAVLLGTKRIGHGYGLIKHPRVMEIVKEKDIAIEINPVSNQVLKLVDDYRNHPGSALLSQNFPLVVSSDDPSFWEVAPLTHDFYMAFLGLASGNSDLRTLKKLAKNSIKYSAMNATEKAGAYDKWQHKWDKFIVDLIANDKSGAATRTD